MSDESKKSKMKSISTLMYWVLFASLLLMNQKLIAQDNNQLDSLINQNLFMIIERYDQYYNDVWKGEKSIKKDFCIFTDNISIGFEFSDEIRNTEVQFISESNMTESQLKEGLYGASLIEVFLYNNKLVINYNTKGIKLKGNKKMIGLSDYYMFEYEFSCDYDKWILIKTSPETFK